MNSLKSALIFILFTFGNLYLAAIFLRFLMQYLGANFYNNICQFLLRITAKPIFVFRKYIPSYRNIDVPSITFLYIFSFLLIGTITIIQGFWQNDILTNIMMIAIQATFNIMHVILDVYFYFIIINAIMSFVPIMYNTGVGYIVSLVSEPVLSFVRRFIPPISGLDLSPLIVIVGISALRIIF